jgi:microcystin-dependent protein
MSNPYVGEIRYVGFNFAPQGWAFCNGQLLAISQFETLFNLIGTTYGGDGQNTFALPDLQGRVAIHQLQQGESFVMGEFGGTEAVTLLINEIPSHSHTIGAVAANGNAPTPGGNVFAASSAGQFVPVASATGAMGNMVSPIGGNQPHTNLQPYLVLNPIISLFGIFPSQS